MPSNFCNFSGGKLLSCTLYGEPAATTIRAYEAAPIEDPVYVIIQLALVEHDTNGEV